MANSAHTLTANTPPGNVANQILGVIQTAFTADDTNGTIPDLTVNFPKDCELLFIRTTVGGTAPTANWDVTLDDANAVDFLDGAGSNRAQADEIDPIVYASTSVNVILPRGAYNLEVAGNSVNSATGTVEIFYRPLAGGAA